MYQTRLYTFPEGKDYTEISLQTLENEFNLLSQEDFKSLSEILDIYTSIDSRELRHEMRAYKHYLTARNDIILAIIKK